MKNECNLNIAEEISETKPSSIAYKENAAISPGFHNIINRMQAVTIV